MKKKYSTWKQYKKCKYLFLMFIPVILYFVIFCYVPMYGVIISFQDYYPRLGITGSEWVGFKHFEKLFTGRYFFPVLRNTLIISIGKLLFGFPAPIILCLLLNEVRSLKFKKVVQTISYLPHFLSWIVLGGMLISWMSTNGMFNQILMGLGIIKEGKNILLDADKYWWIASLSDVWKEAGWGTILYLATMAGIDPTYYEAARIDGASRFRQIISITIPLIKTIICLNFILTISGLLNSNLDQTLVLMNTQNQETAEVINSYVYRMGLAQGDFSYATAAGLGVSIVSVVLLVLANLLTKKLNDRSVL